MVTAPSRSRAAKSVPRKRLLQRSSRQDDTEEWLLSFLDLLTLLMASFTFMLSFAHFSAKPPAAGPASSCVNAGAVQAMAVAQPASQQQQQPEIDPLTRKLAEQLRDKLKSFSAGPDLSIDMLPGKITLSMREQILFASAQAELVDGADKVMAQIAPALLSSPYTLSVEGHTDNIPISSERYQSNWALSAARAISVVEQLVQRGIPANRLRAVAYGDTQPVADNATPEGRSQNRRVVIVVHVEKE